MNMNIFYRVKDKMETTLWKRFINGENDIRRWWKEVEITVEDR